MPRRGLVAVGVLAAGAVIASIGRRALFAWVFARLEPAPLGSVAVPDGLPDLSARTCAACHPDQYAEWAATRMGQATTDPVFVADFEAQGRPFVCLRCHAPLDGQQPVVVTGLASLDPLAGRGDPNPAFDAALYAEGVTCAACHVVDGAIVGPYADATAPHPTRQGDPAAGCARCHQLDPPPLTRLRRPLPDTVAEHARWQAATGRTEGCVDCHMTPVTRPAALGGPDRPGRRHDFRGAWDADLVRGALALHDARAVDGAVEVDVENLAGHGLPTAEPARALRLAALDARGATIGEVFLMRRVPLPRLNEGDDDTLAPAETRRVRIPTEGAATAVVAELLQLHALPDGVSPAVRDAHQRPIAIDRIEVGGIPR